jgi:2-oxoglutarate dehydrogenase E2 component (dihydrolipoamide succinyltransferase)
MATKIVVPELGESVVEATVGRWLKQEGELVAVGEPLVELETDKVNLEVGAEQAGVLARIERQTGEDVKIGDLLAVIEAAAAQPQPPPKEAVERREPPKGLAQTAKPTPKTEAAKPTPRTQRVVQLEGRGLETRAEQPGRMEKVPATQSQPSPPAAAKRATPTARRIAQEESVDLSQVPSPSGRVTKQDVQTFIERQPIRPEAPAPVPPPTTDRSRMEERIRMSRRRLTIARRLVEAQQTAAMLTTFNEVDMTAALELRQRHKESFKERYGVSLGISSFFVKAAIGALKAFPRLNAEIEGDEMVIKRYHDIGIAIGAPEGLVVPVLRDADRLSFAEIEMAIKELARKSDEGALSLEDLRGGTFTITNGGVFGSLISTPILNPPQVGILGLHKIEERPVAIHGQVVVRSMMYLALSYDHRIVDGREAVQFLVRVKELVEDLEGLFLES